ncbi:translation initiation factor IF-3 [Prosthecobacter algae]|uniref:translation initiation factor IF-3 n=1 Tax=Prosthecobacter algae TaxID=1144682 RepID=UPI0031EDF845
MSTGQFGARPNPNPTPAQPAAGAPAPAAGGATGAPVNRPAAPGGYQPRTGGSGPPFNRPGGRGPQRNNSRYADQTRVNERIRAPKVRVVDGITNQQYGVLPTQQALRMAKERGLDLVEVASNAEPPVCKIVDYGKYKYIQEKHKKEAHKHQKGGKLKELKFRIGIDPHDYLIKIVHAEDFLAEGNKVRIQLQFRGRQMAHQELGHALAAKIKADLSTMGHADQEPKMAGRNINMQMSPLPERQRHRKFKVHLKGVTDEKDMHQGDHDPREDKHDEHDEHHDDHANGDTPAQA